MDKEHIKQLRDEGLEKVREEIVHAMQHIKFPNKTWYTIANHWNSIWVRMGFWMAQIVFVLLKINDVISLPSMIWTTVILGLLSLIHFAYAIARMMGVYKIQKHVNALLGTNFDRAWLEKNMVKWKMIEPFFRK